MLLRVKDLLALVAALFAAGSAGAAERYVAHELVVGAHPLYPNALNDRGVVVGRTNGDKPAWDAKAFHLELKGPRRYSAYAPFDSAWAAGMAVNTAGAVAGYYDVGHAEQSHAYLRTPDGSLIELFASEPGAYTAAYGLNASNTVVGSYRREVLVPSQPFAWTQGKVRLLAVPSGDSSGEATAINDSGVIVGTSSTSNWGTRPLRWLPGSDQPQELPGLHGGLENFWSTPHAVNAAGTVVGTCTLANGTFHACAWPADGGMAQDLGALPGDQPSYAFAINGSGLIVGRATAEDGSSRAVLFTGGQLVELQPMTTRLPPQVNLTSAVAINDRGWILVHAQTQGTELERHFLLQPKSSAKLPD